MQKFKIRGYFPEIADQNRLHGSSNVRAYSSRYLFAELCFDTVEWKPNTIIPPPSDQAYDIIIPRVNYKFVSASIFYAILSN